MADKGDDGDTDSMEEVEENNVQTGKKKKDWKKKIKNAREKFRPKSKKRVAPDDHSSKRGGANPRAVPTGEGSFRMSSDSSTSDVSSHREMPPLVEEGSDSHQAKCLVTLPSHVVPLGRFHQDGHNSATVLPHTHPSPATTDSAHSMVGQPSTYDHLPMISKAQGQEQVFPGQSQVQPSERSFIAIPQKSNDHRMSEEERKVRKENAGLTGRINEVEKMNYVLQGENDQYVRQLAAERRVWSKEKEDAVRALADAERRLAEEKAIWVQEQERLIQNLEAKSKENNDLVMQLQMKEDHPRQLKEQLAQKERELHAVHKQLLEAKQQSEFFCSQSESLKQQIAQVQQQSNQRLNELANDVMEREKHVKHLKDANTLLHKELCDAQAEIQKKAEEFKSTQELITKTKHAEVQMTAAMTQEGQKSQDLTRRLAKEVAHSTRLQEEFQQKEEEFRITIEKIKEEMAAVSPKIEVPPSLTGSEGGGANASSGPSSLEEQKKIVLFEDSMKVKDEELQSLRQEKVALERELREEKVAKNHLDSENRRLTAELQSKPDHTALMAQISEYEKGLQDFKLNEERLRRKMYTLQQEHGHTVPHSHNSHILREKEEKIYKLEQDLRREKQSLLDFGRTVQEKDEAIRRLEEDLRKSREEQETEKKEKQNFLEFHKILQTKDDTICKLEMDLRESRKEKERENKENGALQVHENYAKVLEKRVAELEESLNKEKESVQALKDQKKAADIQAAAKLDQLRASRESLQKRIDDNEAAYKREMALHEETSGNLEKAREKAREFIRVVDRQQAELLQLKQQLEQTEQQLFEANQQLDRLVADKESQEQLMKISLAAKDEAIANLKHETNEIRLRMKEQYALVSTELTSAMECVNSKETEMDQLRANVEKLKSDLEVSRAQAEIYKGDFEEERRSRENIKGEVADVEKKATTAINKLHTTIDELKTQNQQLRTRLEGVLNENRRQEEKLNEVKAKKTAILKQVDELKEELETSQAQIRGYKMQSDGLKKDLEDLKEAIKRKDEALRRSGEIHQKAIRLEKELDSEKNNHEHFKGAFGRANAIIEDLRANKAQLEEALKVLQYQNAQLTEYQARTEAKRNKARQALGLQGSQPLPSHFSTSGHLPSANVDYEMERGLNTGGQQVMSGRGEAAAVRSRSNQGHVQGSSANSRHQQVQPGISPSYPQHPQQQPQPSHLQEYTAAGQGYNRSGPSSLDNASLAVHESGHTNHGQKVHTYNFSQPTQVSDPTLQPAQPVIHSNVNTSYPKKVHSQAPSQLGHTNVDPSALQKSQPSSNAAYSQHPVQLPASQQTNQRAQDNRQLPLQGISASQSVKKSSDDHATLAENPLMDNIDQDIEEVAGEVRHMSGPPSTAEHKLQGEQGFEIPIDPNLVCSKCGAMFRHGEIQKLRKHYDQCNGRQR